MAQITESIHREAVTMAATLELAADVRVIRKGRHLFAVQLAPILTLEDAETLREAIRSLPATIRALAAGSTAEAKGSSKRLSDRRGTISAECRALAAKRLRRAREAAGLTQEALAIQAGEGRRLVSRIECYKIDVRADRLCAMAHAVGVSMGYLLGTGGRYPRVWTNGARPKSFGDRLVARREMLGLRQYELAQDTGQGAKALERYEKGRVLPRVSTLAVLCEVLEIGPDELLDDLYKEDA